MPDKAPSDIHRGETVPPALKRRSDRLLDRTMREWREAIEQKRLTVSPTVAAPAACQFEPRLSGRDAPIRFP
jgi:hypothetical protein